MRDCGNWRWTAFGCRGGPFCSGRFGGGQLWGGRLWGGQLWGGQLWGGQLCGGQVACCGRGFGVGMQRSSTMAPTVTAANTAKFFHHSEFASSRTMRKASAATTPINGSVPPRLEHEVTMASVLSTTMAAMATPLTFNRSMICGAMIAGYHPTIQTSARTAAIIRCTAPTARAIHAAGDLIRTASDPR